jgi:hypothetical protein
VVISYPAAAFDLKNCATKAGQNQFRPWPLTIALNDASRDVGDQFEVLELPSASALSELCCSSLHAYHSTESSSLLLILSPCPVHARMGASQTWPYRRRPWVCQMQPEPAQAPAGQLQASRAPLRRRPG